MKLRLGAAFPDNPGVVGVLVRIAHTIDHTERLGDRARDVLVELLGQRQQQCDERVVVLGLDGQRVEADALRFGRLVQQPITFGLGDCARYRFRRQSLELRIPYEPPTANRYSTSETFAAV